MCPARTLGQQWRTPARHLGFLPLPFRVLVMCPVLAARLPLASWPLGAPHRHHWERQTQCPQCLGAWGSALAHPPWQGATPHLFPRFLFRRGTVHQVALTVLVLTRALPGPSNFRRPMLGPLPRPPSGICASSTCELAQIALCCRPGAWQPRQSSRTLMAWSLVGLQPKAHALSSRSAASCYRAVSTAMQCSCPLGRPRCSGLSNHHFQYHT